MHRATLLAARRQTIALIALLCCGPSQFGLASAQAPTSPTAYVIGTAHLDTQWQWTIQGTIERILATLRENFVLIDRYSSYNFSFEGAIRYMLAKEYFPGDYQRLKGYIATGRWFVAGSWVDAVDVNIPSPESLVRQTLYGNGFFNREFGKTSRDVFLPDCFGFNYALPSVAAHSGLKGFSTSKLGWGSSVGIPFRLGAWKGIDGSVIGAAFDPGHYTSSINGNLANDQTLLTTINNLGSASGVYAGYQYFGVGDLGGAPSEASVSNLHQSVNTTGPVRVLSASSDQLFKDLTPAQLGALPLYDGELLLKTHGTGCYTSQTAMKLTNRRNETLADQAERACVVGSLLGGMTYPTERLREAWVRFLWHQFHDDLTGTSIELAYRFSINDEVIASNQFADMLAHATAVTATALDTRVNGIPLVVYNPVAIDRQDVVEANVRFDSAAPAAVRVTDAQGNEVPSQITASQGDVATVLFLASVQSVGYAAYGVERASAPYAGSGGPSASASGLSSGRYTVSVNAAGDITSIYDRQLSRELLSAPMRLPLFDHNSHDFPAWELLYSDLTAAPVGYVSGNGQVRVAENGPVRASLAVTRGNDSASVTQHIRLTLGDGAKVVDIVTELEWHGRGRILKASFPLSVASPSATYDLGLGVVRRPTNTANLYEVPAQEWVDLSDSVAGCGVTLMSNSRYGWDKPDSRTMRLTLVHTPKQGTEVNQQDMDLGVHSVSYALMGHSGDWRTGGAVRAAACYNRPLLAFQTTSHAGGLGSSFSLASSDTAAMHIMAIKKAEESDEIVVRVRETMGRALGNARVVFAAPITAAREINGAEEAVGSASFSGSALVVNLTAYQPRAFAVRLAALPAQVSLPVSRPMALPWNTDVASADSQRNDGVCDGSGNAIAAELLPDTIRSIDIAFVTGPTSSRQNNALACAGQSLPVDGAQYTDVYLLAARSDTVDRGMVSSRRAYGAGFTGNYYQDTAFTDLRLSRTDTCIDFAAASTTVPQLTNRNLFAVRWTGTIRVSVSGPSRFTTRAVDGIRLWVNGVLLIDQWRYNLLHVDEGVVVLEAGRDNDVRVDWWRGGGGDVVSLRWDSPHMLTPAADTFRVNGSPVAVGPVQRICGPVGLHRPLDIVTRDPIAWVGTHRHRSDGLNEPYVFTQLHRYRIPLSPTATQIVLPASASIKILAATQVRSALASAFPVVSGFPVRIDPAQPRDLPVSVLMGAPQTPMRPAVQSQTPQLAAAQWSQVSPRAERPQTLLQRTGTVTAPCAGPAPDNVLAILADAPFAPVADRTQGALSLADPAADLPARVGEETARATVRNDTSAPRRRLPVSSVNACSFDRVHRPLNAVDGDPTTRWTARHGGRQWLTLDLGHAATVSGAWCALYQRSRDTVSVEMETSADGVAWTHAWRGVLVKRGAQEIVCPCDRRPARYVRLRFLSRQPISCREVRIVDTIDETDR